MAKPLPKVNRVVIYTDNGVFELEGDAANLWFRTVLTTTGNAILEGQKVPSFKWNKRDTPVVQKD